LLFTEEGPALLFSEHPELLLHVDGLKSINNKVKFTHHQKGKSGEKKVKR